MTIMFNEASHTYVDAGFKKSWDKDLMKLIKKTVGSLTQTASNLYMLLRQEVKTGNRVYMTQAKMADMLNVSTRSISRSMNQLRGSTLLKKDGNGNYMLNPKLIHKGSSGYRLGLMKEFDEIEDELVLTSINENKKRKYRKKTQSILKRVEKAEDNTGEKVSEQKMSNKKETPRIGSLSSKIEKIFSDIISEKKESVGVSSPSSSCYSDEILGHIHHGINHHIELFLQKLNKLLE